jgi:cellulose synthase/poly-beta-1,6-N-acetylglucosamine synthase-like glycosyltransferase
LIIACHNEEDVIEAKIENTRALDYPDARLFNGPPFRPRVNAWLDGTPVKFITYEASWMPSWIGTNFPAEQAEVFIISYEAVFRQGFTILNIAGGAPHSTTFQKYSPMWRAHCIVDAVNQKCGISVNQYVPGYFQCKTEASCLRMVNTATGFQVLDIKPSTFSHINCPMVAVDLDGDNYIAPHEEMVFPNLWVSGPVTVL